MFAISRFLDDDAGAITVDWVALTAGILLLGIVITFAIYNLGVKPMALTINSELQQIGVDISIGDPLTCEDLGNCT